MLERAELQDLEMCVSSWRMQDVIISTLACMPMKILVIVVALIDHLVIIAY